MECKLLYLYDDLMNLYGENGNIRVLTRHLQDQGFSVTVDRRSLSDSLDFSGYALIYLGSGTESARNAALRHLETPGKFSALPSQQAPEKRSRASDFLHLPSRNPAKSASPETSSPTVPFFRIRLSDSSTSAAKRTA